MQAHGFRGVPMCQPYGWNVCVRKVSAGHNDVGPISLFSKQISRGLAGEEESASDRQVWWSSSTGGEREPRGYEAGWWVASSCSRHNFTQLSFYINCSFVSLETASLVSSCIYVREGVGKQYSGEPVPVLAWLLHWMDVFCWRFLFLWLLVETYQ